MSRTEAQVVLAKIFLHLQRGRSVFSAEGAKNIFAKILDMVAFQKNQNRLSGQLAGYVKGSEKEPKQVSTVKEFQDSISGRKVFSGLFL